MYLYLTPLLPFLLSACLSAQTYTFSVSTQGYTELEGGTLINVDSVTQEATLWDDENYSIPLGFTFQLFDVSMDTLHIEENGLITSYSLEDSPEPENPAQLIIGYYEDLVDRAFIGGETSLSPITYHLTGTAPNRIGILQFKNAGFYAEFQEDNVSDYFTNFQFWVYESGTFEIHYGQTSAEILNGTEETDFAVLLLKDYFYDDDIDSDGYSEGYYLAGDPENPVFTPLATQNLEDYNYYLDGVPPSGTVYRFVNSGTSGLFVSNPVVDALNIFPNPTSDRINFSLPEHLRGRVDRLELFDGAGRRVRHLAFAPTYVDLGNMPAGMYQVRITTDTGNILTGRAVKR